MPFITQTIVSSLYSYFHNRTWDAHFASRDELKQTLKQVIDRSLDRYKAERPYTGTDGRVPFYDSARVVEELLKYRLMHSDDYNVEALLTALADDTRLVPPEKADIDEFYRIFVEEVSADERLKPLEIKATFTTEIFVVSAKIDKLQRSFEQQSKIFTADLEVQWRSRAESYFEMIRQFKFATALTLLEAFEKSISESEQIPPPRVLANIAYQKGLCFQHLGRIDELRKSFVQAYQQNPNNKVFKQRAALAYFKLGQKDQARKLVDELINADEFDYMAWAIKVLDKEVTELKQLLCEIPPVVKKDTSFLYSAINSAETGKKHLILQAFFELDLIPPITDFIDKPVTIDTYAEYILWVDTSINRLFSNFFCNFRIVDCGNPDLTLFLNKLLNKFLAAINNSEIPEKNAILPFLLAYTNFCLTSKDYYALEMATLYDDITVKDDVFILIAANALQLTGHDTEAMALLEKTAEDTTATMVLKARCAMNQRDKEAFAKYTKEWITALNPVSSALVSNYIESLIQLRFLGKLLDFTLDDYLAGKTFESEQDQEMVSTLAEAMFLPHTQARKEQLSHLAEQTIDYEMLSMISMICYFVGEFDLAVSIYRKIMDKTKESRGLEFYIYSLYNTKKDNRELLELVTYWRENFTAHEDFLRLEMQLRRDRLEWKECAEVGSRFLESNPKDEFVLALYVYALHQEGSAESLAVLASLVVSLEQFDFKTPVYAGQVADVMVKRKYFKEGLELLYRYASQPGGDELKMSYFMACVACGNFGDSECPIKEFDTAEAGHFVKYKLQDKIRFVELNPVNLRTSFNQQFIGCGKGGAFTHPRKISGEEDLVSVERIMNKYLYLHDLILEEVRDNPHSAVPMESFDFGGADTMLEKFQQYFGRKGSNAYESFQQDIDKYYQFQMSLSELVLKHSEADYLATYYNLIANHKGLQTLPLTMFPAINEPCAGYVLDYTSLAMFYQMHQYQQAVFPEKFILSKFIVDQLQKELEKQRANGPEFALSVRSDMVIPHFDGASNRENNVIYLTGLLKWINENCVVEISDQLHDYIRQFEQRPEDRAFTEYTLNTCLLVDDVKGRKLITDDFVYSRFGILNMGNLVSTEFYAKNTFGADHAVLYEFIRNRCHSFAVSEAQLNTEYHKKLAGEPNYYDSCLENLSLKINALAVTPSIRHIKHIVLNHVGTDEAMRLAINTVFLKLLDDKPSLLVSSSIAVLIRQECYLMGTKLDIIMSAFQESLLIINAS